MVDKDEADAEEIDVGPMLKWKDKDADRMTPMQPERWRPPRSVNRPRKDPETRDA